MVLLWRANAPFRVREPRAGPKKLSLNSPETTFLKFGAFRRLWSRSFLSYRIFLDLSLGPSESSCKKASDWKLLNEILKLDFEISPFLSKKKSKNRLTLSPQSASLVVLEKYCCSTEKAISVSTTHMVLLWRANAPFRVRKPPAGPTKLSLSSPEITFFLNLVHFADFGAGHSWATEFSLDLSLAPSESSCKKLQIESFSTKILRLDLEISPFFVKRKLRKIA